MRATPRPDHLGTLLPTSRRLSTPHLFLRRFQQRDAPVLHRVLQESADWLRPWSPPFTADISIADIAKNIRRGHRETRRCQRLDLGIFEQETGALIGKVGFHTMVYGVAFCAGLGYWIAGSAAGHGYMTQAVATLVAFGFEELGFHRIWAGVQFSNVASQRVLEKLSFVREGAHRQEVFIDGAWRDQYYYTLLREEYDQLAEQWENQGFVGATPDDHEPCRG